MINRLNANNSAYPVQKQNRPAVKHSPGFGVSLVSPEREREIAEQVKADFKQAVRETGEISRRLNEANRQVGLEVVAKATAEQQAKVAKSTPQATQPGWFGRILGKFAKN